MRLQHALGAGDSIDFSAAGESKRTLISGVGYHWQRDASFGLTVTQALSKLSWPAGIEISDLDYGALYAVQDLSNAKPPYKRLVLIAGIPRGRTPGSVHSYRWQPQAITDEDLQARIREAGGGVVDLDHLLMIAEHFKALPQEVWIFEFEPVDSSWGEQSTPEAKLAMEEVVSQIRHVALENPGIPEAHA